MNGMEALRNKGLQIQQKKRHLGLVTCYARIMSEFNVQYSEFHKMPLPFFLKLINLIIEQDKAQKKANKKR